MTKAIVVHSGGMDSSICLALAAQEFGNENVISLSFSYDQRHLVELNQAKKIAKTWNIPHTELPLPTLQAITDNALINPETPISHEGRFPNTLVVGRNGLMARLAAIYAHHLGAHIIYMGIIEVESYRDCSRTYMDMMEKILQIDLDDPSFEIRTPLVKMTKKETMEVAHKLGVLPFLIKETITCYEGLFHPGCQKCPACLLRNEGLQLWKEQKSDQNLR